MNSHTLSRFDEDLNEIKSEINTLAELVLEEYQQAIEIFEKPNEKMAKKVVKQDKKANESLKKIELHGARVLARQNAVADDLRFILCSMRIAPRLERVGDYAKGMATRSSKFEDVIPDELSEKFREMHLHMMAMLKSVIEAYNDNNLAQAIVVKEGDEELNDQYKEVFSSLVKGLNTCANPEQQVELLFIAKGIERAGDHISDIAKDVKFMVRG